MLAGPQVIAETARAYEGKAALPFPRRLIAALKAGEAAGGDKRVIAYIHGSTPISREEFGDYLIQLFGRDRVRLYVNRRIIEAAAAKRGIVVTPQEVSAVIDQARQGDVAGARINAQRAGADADRERRRARWRQ